MVQRPCRFCPCSFQPSRFHPEQTVCAAAKCQRQRRREYHRRKVAADSVYRQVCNDSSQKWRAENPGYWKRYREAHPDKANRNRALPQTRDQKRRVRHLANNILATTQVFIVEGLNQRPRNLTNNNALVSAPVLPDNRISPNPC